MHRASLLKVTVVLLLALVGVIAVSSSYRDRGRHDTPSQPRTHPAVPQVDPAVAVPELTPTNPPHQLAKQQPPPLTKAAKSGLTFSVAQVRRGRTVALRSRPGGHVRATVAATTEYGSTTTLAVAEKRGRWLGLTSSDLPNGKLGWVHDGNRSLDIYETALSVRIDLSRRTLELRNGRDVVRRARVGIGRFGSATPRGRFSITDSLRGPAFGSYYGCCILALSGHQPHTPPGWSGGNRLAIHGTDHPRSVGLRSSAGCLRAGARNMHALIRRVPLGTPVFIHA